MNLSEITKLIEQYFDKILKQETKLTQSVKLKINNYFDSVKQELFYNYGEILKQENFDLDCICKKEENINQKVDDLEFKVKENNFDDAKKQISKLFENTIIALEKLNKELKFIQNDYESLKSDYFFDRVTEGLTIIVDKYCDRGNSNFNTNTRVDKDSEHHIKGIKNQIKHLRYEIDECFKKCIYSINEIDTNFKLNLHKDNYIKIINDCNNMVNKNKTSVTKLKLELRKINEDICSEIEKNELKNYLESAHNYLKSIIELYNEELNLLQDKLDDDIKYQSDNLITKKQTYESNIYNNDKTLQESEIYSNLIIDECKTTINYEFEQSEEKIKNTNISKLLIDLDSDKISLALKNKKRLDISKEQLVEDTKLQKLMIELKKHLEKYSHF